MKLLFDQNISFKVAKNSQHLFIDSKHISDVGLSFSLDIEIWEFARNNNYCIVTFDADFIDISALKGFPPKIIWLRIGNTSTNNLILKLQTDLLIIKDFLNNSEMGFLELK